MGSYEDGYASAPIPSITQRTEISIEDKKAFLLKDIEDARESIKVFETSIQDSKNGIDAANNIIKIATAWIKEYEAM
ncbi:MAG: hypothetical protein KAJ39_05040 [Gammaproteobacteria bacterium]|nr:hypothetical protein [Gammaproteobacteria bacterium]